MFLLYKNQQMTKKTFLSPLLVAANILPWKTLLLPNGLLFVKLKEMHSSYKKI